MFGLYPSLFLHPSEFMFSASGDGMKNYLVPAWMVCYSPSWTAFDGMNYPFGESFFYTDGNPAFVWLLKLFQPILQLSPKQVVGAMNTLILWSFPLAGLLYSKIIRKYSKQRLGSILLGTSLMLLAPQIFRTEGHFSLAHPEAIPLVWLLADNLQKAKSRKRILLLISLFAVNLWYVFSHPYLGVMTSLFSGILLLATMTNRISIKGIAQAVLTMLLPPVIFQLVVKLTDQHLDRPTDVSGFFLYTAEPDDVFIPVSGPIKNYLIKVAGLHQQWEAWSYIGLGAVLIILFSIIRWTIYRRSFSNTPRNLNVAFIPALIFLLWAFGMPFKLGLEEYLNHFSMLKQFRAIGRFTWPFFTVCTVWAAVVALKWSKKHGAFHLVWVALFCLNIWEGHLNYEHFTTALKANKNTFTSSTTLQGTATYQAILPLPFFSLGSETFDKSVDGSHVAPVHVASINQRLPNIASQLIRLSIPESKALMGSFTRFQPADSLLTPVLEDGRPILLMVSKHERLRPEEQALVPFAEWQYEDELFNYFNLNPIDWLTSPAISHKLDTLSRPNFYMDYKNDRETPSIGNTGSLLLDRRNDTAFQYVDCGLFEEDSLYFATIYLYHKPPYAINRGYYLAVKHCEQPESDCELLDIIKAQEALTMWDDFSGIRLQFRAPKHSNGKLRFETFYKGKDSALISIDKLIIHPAYQHTFQPINDSLGILNGDVVEVY